MITLTLCLLVLFMLFPAALGLLVIFYVFVKPMKAPADTSNRIAHLRLVWFALREAERFVPLFPWLTKDEGDLVDVEDEHRVT